MPEELDKCVNKVKGQKGIDNAYAICNASLQEKHEETVSIPSSLSAVSIGAKKLEESVIKQLLEAQIKESI